MRTLALFAFLFFVNAVYGQVADSVSIKKLEKRKKLLERDKRTRDSLKTVFYLSAPVFEVCLEVKHENVPLHGDFYATNDTIKYDLKKYGNPEQGLEKFPDSMRFVLEVNFLKLSTPFLKRRHYEHGASITFGYFDNDEFCFDWQKMKMRKVVGIALIILATYVFIEGFDVFTDAWYALTRSDYPLYPQQYWVILGRAILCLAAYLAAVSIGRILAKAEQLNKRFRLIYIVAMFLILEIPLYPCEFGVRAHHSFWLSHLHHFH